MCIHNVGKTILNTVKVEMFALHSFSLPLTLNLSGAKLQNTSIYTLYVCICETNLKLRPAKRTTFSMLNYTVIFCEEAKFCENKSLQKLIIAIL